MKHKACCSPEAAQAAGVPAGPATVGSRNHRGYLLSGILLLTGWWLLYRSLAPFSTWLTYDVFSLTRGSGFASAVEFFIFDTPKVLLLLILVVFGVGVARSCFTPERARRILAGKREAAGNVFAALLGIVTPFCSCSAVPMFIGFVTAGVPLGVTFSFLISAPMVNEIALVLLFGLFGWKIAALYLGTGLGIAMIAGWTIGRLGMEKHVEPWVYQAMGIEEERAEEESMSIADRIRYGVEAVRDIVGKVWVYVVLGIAVGAGIHGYVPENFMASFMGSGAWWSVPLAVLIGIPMYSNAAGIIPIVQALSGEGSGPGDRPGVHDVGHRAFPAGDDHPPQGAEGTADRDVRRRGGDRDPDRRIPLQSGPLMRHRSNDSRRKT